ncbi:MAG: hypothetical protein F6K54_11175 [Okeania sp. SIO3B5]|uniref:hypothetical protein n=1 Tax=Okeania sp. SIO3B5 TaxID=2607811 RepID=UPI0013FEFEBB|nr:hypothetical protein [Okeania sp. SIO3B5]NEO53593.1 hypothetical protein [Okeania sp. SIO3B5]
MWEKIWLAVAITLSLHIFSGIDLSHLKLPFTSLSPVVKADSDMPKTLFLKKTIPSSNLTNLTNIKVLINR